MVLKGVSQAALTGLMGFDTDMVISRSTARKFAADGYAFCLRYIPHSGQVYTDHDLSVGETNDILDAGLALMSVQHVRPPHWKITEGLGKSDGEAAGDRVYALGFPQSDKPERCICVWCDLEQIELGTPVEVVQDYCTQWAEAVRARQYLPGLYVGYQCILDEKRLAELNFDYYWRSQSRTVPNVNPKGFQIIQLYPEIQVNGLRVDIDVTQIVEDVKSPADKAHWLIR